MELVDTHCHLQFEKLAGQLDQVIEAAGSKGVNKMLCVGTTLSDSSKAIELAKDRQNVWASAGTHPHDAKAFLEESNAIAELRDLLEKPKVVAVGEIGLDFYKNYSEKPDQEKVFRLQLEAGFETGLPFIFHVRDAWVDFWRILKDYPEISGVVHSFSATTTELNQILDKGLYVGLNGIMTFTSDEQQLEAAKKAPLNRLLLETDAPFLTPKPYRGKLCEPKHVRTIAEFLTELRGEPIEQLADATTSNAKELFKLT